MDEIDKVDAVDDLNDLDEFEKSQPFNKNVAHGRGGGGPFEWLSTEPWPGVTHAQWSDWRWQLRNSWRTVEDFAQKWQLSSDEREGFAQAGKIFRVRTTPYYARLAHPLEPQDPLRKIMVPVAAETQAGYQAELDPLGERRHRPSPRIVHRYSDRVLFLVTDTCSVYCRYCTRKHFTASGAATAHGADYAAALNYIRRQPGVREVILSGGDPLTLSDQALIKVVGDIREIPHVEIIRIATRMPVVCPMRITESLVMSLRPFAPIFFMVHFNHPRELTSEAAAALTLLVDQGFPCFNQMVLLNGVNNHASIIQALSRRLLYLRVYPYYMFQCDPSQGTDHLRTSLDNSLSVQRELWGHLSGLALPQLSLDIPSGGGKVYYTPQFEQQKSRVEDHPAECRHYLGWDGVEAVYVSPPSELMQTPADAHLYAAEWETLRGQSRPGPRNGN